MLFLLGIAVVSVILYVGIYNGLVGARQKVREAWSGIDVQLKRRLDLIPNLVNMVKGYAAHEKGIMERVTEERAKALSAGSDPAARAKAEGELTRGLKSIFALAENYPQLKADATFLNLQQQLGETEDQIAAARRIYNGNVQAYNTRIATVPGNLVAGLHGFAAEKFFEMEEGEAARAAETPEVSF
jgi:LemA protein